MGRQDAAAFTNEVVVDGVHLLCRIETPSKRVFHKLTTTQECQYRQVCFGCAIQNQQDCNTSVTFDM